MLICHCRAVSERTIVTAIAAGARCPEQIAAMCGAGATCGGCHPALEDLLARHVPRPRLGPTAA